MKIIKLTDYHNNKVYNAKLCSLYRYTQIYNHCKNQSLVAFDNENGNFKSILINGNIFDILRRIKR